MLYLNQEIFTLCNFCKIFIAASTVKMLNLCGTTEHTLICASSRLAYQTLFNFNCIVTFSSPRLQILGWAEHEIREQMSHHQPQEQRVSTGTTPSTAASHVHSPSTSMPSPPTQSVATPPAPTPFQPRPQPYVPQRSSRQLRPPPPRHMLTDWENEFISKNKDEIYDLLLVRNNFSMIILCSWKKLYSTRCVPMNLACP